MTLVSVTAYHLYGTISVNTIFLEFFLLLWSVYVSALIVRHRRRPCSRAQLEAIRSEGSSPFSADHRAAYLYSVGPRDPNHDAVIRIGGEAPGRRAHSPYGVDTMRYGGWPPPRIGLKPCYIFCIRLRLACWSSRCSRYRRAQSNTFRNFAGRHHAPQRDEQFACKRDDHGLACATAPIRRSSAVP